MGQGAEATLGVTIPRTSVAQGAYHWQAWDRRVTKAVGSPPLGWGSPAGGPQGQ